MTVCFTTIGSTVSNASKQTGEHKPTGMDGFFNLKNLAKFFITLALSVLIQPLFC